MPNQNSTTPEVRSFVYKQALKFLIAGLVLLIGSIILTYIGYQDAEAGDSYLILYGAMAVGLGLTIKAIILFVKPERMFFGTPANPVIIKTTSKLKFFFIVLGAIFVALAILFAFTSSDISIYGAMLIVALVCAAFASATATLFYWLNNRK